MKRAVALLGMILSVICIFCFSACRKPVKLDGDYVVIAVEEGKGGVTLLSYMQDLQEEGELAFTVENGMVTSIAGKANDSDYNPCWMLYTSDTENANDAWGVVEYDGKRYGSAVVGVETLLVKAGETYIWWYQSF